MRITGGLARGIVLRVPGGDQVRPATDAMRQAVFSSLGARVAGATFLDLFAGAGGYGLEALSRGAASGVFIEKNAAAAACLRQNLAAVRKSLGSAPPPGGQVVRAAPAPDEKTSPAVQMADRPGAPPDEQTVQEASAAHGNRAAPQRADQPDVILIEGDAVKGAWPERPPELVFVDPPYEAIPEVAPRIFARLAEVYPLAGEMIVVFEAPGEVVLAPSGWILKKRLGKGSRQPTASFFRREPVH